jgi:hypothetical protein
MTSGCLYDFKYCWLNQALNSIMELLNKSQIDSAVDSKRFTCLYKVLD